MRLLGPACLSLLGCAPSPDAGVLAQAVRVEVARSLGAGTLVGDGFVIRDAGRRVLGPDGAVQFEAGPHPVFSVTDEKLCALIGGS